MGTASAAERDGSDRGGALRVPRLGLLVSAVVLIGLVVFVVTHAAEERRLARLFEHAEPIWMLLAVGLQIGTYLCAGGIWERVASAAGHRLRLRQLARLAVEKLTVDQFLPAGGMAGNVVVVSVMTRLGLSPSVATEALLIDIVAQYGAYAVGSLVASVVLWAHHHLTPIAAGLLGAFALLIAGVPAVIAWLLHHRGWKPGPRLARVAVVRRALSAIATVSVERVRDPRLLATATLLQLAIMALDAATLWAVLAALGVSAHPLTAFVALVMATIAATLSFLPGGVGSFEAGATATLTLLGVPLEAALAGTLLLRGLTLWLPLLPGALLARRDLTAAREALAAPERAPSPAAPLARLLPTLRTDAGGLAAREAATRLERGANELGARRAPSWRSGLVRALLSPLALILLGASVASFVLGEVADAVIIVVMVVLSAAIDVVQSARSERAVRRLQARVTPTATARRDGEWRTIARREVVPGDVVRLAAGDLVPADARLLESVDLHVQQAALTGEPLPVEKRAVQGALDEVGPRSPGLLFVGTSVVSGAGTAVVFATGPQTAFGDIVARIAERPAETELERGLRRFGVLILQTVVFLVSFIVLVSVAMGREPFQALLFAVALAVGLTPEYLPMITTVTLAQGAVRMAREKVIVKHLAAIQNLGSVDVLCSDKTGTLTTGEMSLEAALDARGRACDRPLSLGAINSELETGVRSPLDAAILARRRAGEGYRKIAEVPFDFERRRLSVAAERGGERLLVTKGAPESVLACCDRVEHGGEARPLDEASRASCLETVRRLSEEGLRVLAVASRPLREGERVDRGAEQGLALAGFLSFADPPLEGAAEAIARLREDGVTVKILTGDDVLVARSVCRRVGVEVDRVVSGEELARLDPLGLARVAEDCTVFARLTPAQKHRIVLALEHAGHVVGFLGDGINDAPSLHAAAVGISVAGAVDVAQEASDLVLMEKRLDTLHRGILAGRRSFANVLKYLLMGTSSNFGNMLSMAGAVIFLPFLPMLPTQILVNNFLYDLAQITIPTDDVDPSFLRSPQRWDVGVIRRFMLFVGPLSSIFDVVTFTVLLLAFHFAEASFQTGWFVESLLTQVLVLFVIRTAGRPWRQRPSRALTATVLLVSCVAAALPFTPLAPWLGMRPLPPAYYLFVALVVPTYLGLVELVKSRLLRRIRA